MNHAFIRFTRAVAFTLLALIGGMMALIFMISTGLALGVLYIIAMIRGRPFNLHTTWYQRQARRNRARNAFHNAADGEIIDAEVRQVEERGVADGDGADRNTADRDTKTPDSQAQDPDPKPHRPR